MGWFESKADKRLYDRTLAQQYAGTFKLRKLRKDFGKKRKKKSGG